MNATTKNTREKKKKLSLTGHDCSSYKLLEKNKIQFGPREILYANLFIS
jgi:hypothetical protein